MLTLPWGTKLKTGESAIILGKVGTGKTRLAIRLLVEATVAVDVHSRENNHDHFVQCYKEARAVAGGSANGISYRGHSIPLTPGNLLVADVTTVKEALAVNTLTKRANCTLLTCAQIDRLGRVLGGLERIVEEFDYVYTIQVNGVVVDSKSEFSTGTSIAVAKWEPSTMKLELW